MVADYTGVINTAIQTLPAILALLRTNHAAANPSDAPLTDAQAFAALHEAVLEGIAKDDALAADVKARNA